jgi:hypothetical protein
MTKPEAEPEPGFSWRQWRPIGLPYGKRDAMAEAEAEPGFSWRQWRPIGLPYGKRKFKP